MGLGCAVCATAVCVLCYLRNRRGKTVPSAREFLGKGRQLINARLTSRGQITADPDADARSPAGLLRRGGLHGLRYGDVKMGRTQADVACFQDKTRRSENTESCVSRGPHNKVLCHRNGKKREKNYKRKIANPL